MDAFWGKTCLRAPFISVGTLPSALAGYEEVNSIIC